MQQKTLDRKDRGYYDGFEACFDDYAMFLKLDLKEELEQAVGHEVLSPLIIEEDEEEDNPCPPNCPAVLDIEEEDNECPHCNFLSLKMGYTEPYLRK